MPRTADYTIQGFLYQFNKTALEILNAQDDDTITVEGILEDIEITSPSSLTAIQCKYHEASKTFTQSTVYKPLLQMLEHYSAHPNANIRYVLFAHVSGNTTPASDVSLNTFKAALASKDKELQKYIKAIPSNIDLNKFEATFTMKFGPSYDELVTQVCQKLETNGIPSCDIETLAYPNAIHIIASLSIKHDVADREITKSQFLSQLESIRTTAISRWTLALKTRVKLLKTKREQLKVHLSNNTRLRYFVVDPTHIADYEEEIVLFINDYIEKYHFKPAHISTPTICLCVERDDVLDIQRRLYAKGIVSTNGYVGAQFEESYFYREPLVSKGTGNKIRREFAIRILNWDDHGSVLNNRKCDDLFIVGEPNCDALDTVDVNVEQLAGVTMKELKYVIGVSNVYE